MPQHSNAAPADDPPIEKPCAECGIPKPLSDFPSQRTRKGTLSIKGTCKECKKLYMKQWHSENKEHHASKCREYRKRVDYNGQRRERYQTDPEYRRAILEKIAAFRRENPDKEKDKDLREIYGITLDDYRALLSLQGGGCAICGRKQSASKGSKSLHVDHDHRTGKIRGILCDGCNQGLGRFRDSPRYLRKAAAYLEASRDRDPRHPESTPALFPHLHDPEDSDDVA